MLLFGAILSGVNDFVNVGGDPAVTVSVAFAGDAAMANPFSVPVACELVFWNVPETPDGN